jgi:hypothetical protein
LGSGTRGSSNWGLLFFRTRLRGRAGLRSRTWLRARSSSGTVNAGRGVQNLFDFALFIDDAALLLGLLGLLESGERGWAAFGDGGLLASWCGTRSFLARSFLASWFGTTSFGGRNRSGDGSRSGDGTSGLDRGLDNLVFKRSFFKRGGVGVAGVAGLVGELATSAVLFDVPVFAVDDAIDSAGLLLEGAVGVLVTEREGAVGRRELVAAGRFHELFLGLLLFQLEGLAGRLRAGRFAQSRSAAGKFDFFLLLDASRCWLDAVAGRASQWADGTGLLLLNWALADGLDLLLDGFGHFFRNGLLNFF